MVQKSILAFLSSKRDTKSSQNVVDSSRSLNKGEEAASTSKCGKKRCVIDKDDEEKIAIHNDDESENEKKPLKRKQVIDSDESSEDEDDARKSMPSDGQLEKRQRKLISKRKSEDTSCGTMKKKRESCIEVKVSPERNVKKETNQKLSGKFKEKLDRFICRKDENNSVFEKVQNSKSRDINDDEELSKLEVDGLETVKLSVSDREESDQTLTDNQSQENLDASDSHSFEESVPKEQNSPTKEEVKTNHKINKNKSGLSLAENTSIVYNPGKTKYHPIDDSCWKRGERVPYSALARAFEIIEETKGRLKTAEILSNFFRSVIVLTPEDLLLCVYLSSNHLAPAYEGLELGIGETLLMRAIANSTGRSFEKIKKEAAEEGDLGAVAEKSKTSQKMMFKPARLTVSNVFKQLKEIALMSGNSSQNRKIDKIKGMLVACQGTEARYLIRSLEGKLRIGLAEQCLIQALAYACFLTPPSQEFPPNVLNGGQKLSADDIKAHWDEYTLILKTTYCACPSFDLIIPTILKEGFLNLPQFCKLSPGIPLKPMLAHPTKGVSEVLSRFENVAFTCEYKYDGERAQIHMMPDGSIKIYSRNQENNTSKYPDIISRFKNAFNDTVTSCVVDSEAVAWDREEKQILPFQVLSTRKRKDAQKSEIKVQVCVFAFDLLFLNGKPLIQNTFEERRKLLKEHFKQVEGEFQFAKSMDSTNIDDIQEFLEESIKGNCEGLMVKTLSDNATYEIAKRSRNWLKLKKDYLEGVGDTIDVAVLGGYFGKGKRTGLYGGFLLACYDRDNEEYQTLCKTGTGFSDEDLQKHTTFFKEHVIEKPKSYYRYDNSVAPDEWFDAVQVWEIKCADLSISPVHKAALGLVDQEKGISLRFPRFLRIRDDKTPEEATSSLQIVQMYRSQDHINEKNSTTISEDFY